MSSSPIEVLQELAPTYTQFLAALVGANSVYGREAAAQQLVQSKMEELGLTVTRVYSRKDGQAVNLAGRLKGTDESTHRSLILNAHCDVAPVNSPARWSGNPFSAEVIGRTMRGRGCLDDKAGIAIILMVANALQRLDMKLRGDLILEFVIEDETTGNGSKALVEEGITADGVIICDGTWPERIINGHYGQLALDVSVIGPPVAACVEERGINPIYVAMDFIAALRRIVTQWNEGAEGEGAASKPFFMNVGSLQSGAWFGSVPAEARMEI